MCRFVLLWSPALIDCPWVIVLFRGIDRLVYFALVVAFLVLVRPIVFILFVSSGRPP